jgi:hypothetical protein
MNAGKIILKAMGSAGNIYAVEFLADGNSIRVFCHCKAGITGQMCKHKTALIRGDLTLLADSSESAGLREIQTWPQYHALISRLERYEKTLSELQRNSAELVAREKALKAQMGKDLTVGGYQ